MCFFRWLAMSFIFMLLLNSAVPVNAQTNHAFLKGQFWSGSYSSPHDKNDGNLYIYITDISRKQIKALVIFEDRENKLVVFDTKDFLKSGQRELNFARGKCVWDDSKVSQGYKLNSGHFDSTRTRFIGKLKSGSWDRGTFETSLLSVSAARSISAHKIAVDIDYAIRNKLKIVSYLNEQKLKSSSSVPKIGTTYEGQYTLHSVAGELPVTMKVTIAQFTAKARRYNETDIEFAVLTTVNNIPSLCMISGELDLNTNRFTLRTKRKLHPEWVVSHYGPLKKPLMFSQDTFNGIFIATGLKITLPGINGPITLFKTSAPINVDYELAGMLDESYQRALNYAEERKQNWKRVLTKDPLIAEELRINPIHPTLVECFDNRHRAVGQKFRVLDVDQCRRESNYQLASRRKDAKDRVTARETREENIRREQEPLSILKGKLHLAEKYTPKQVRKITESVGARYEKHFSVNGLYIEVYDTSSLNINLPIAYAIFVKDGRKQSLSSFSYWVRITDDSIDSNVAGNMGVLGLLALGEIVKDRNKLQIQLIEKYGTPTSLGDYQLQNDKEPDDISAEDIAVVSKMLTGAIQGANNSIWIKDGGKSMVALRPFSGIPVAYRRKYPSSVYPGGSFLKDIRILEFANTAMYSRIQKMEKINTAF